jgi:hypothetical protein
LTVQIPEEGRLTEVRERAADIRLEDHNRGECDVHEEVTDQPVDRLQRGQP